MEVWGALLEVAQVTSGQVEASSQEQRIDEIHQSSQI